MKGKKLFSLLIFVGFSAFSQVKGIVVDENNQPIPYVNIWVENQDNGATSEENGTFEINVSDKSKILIFSSLGFGTRKIEAAKAEIVMLHSIVVALDEVVISKQKKTQETKAGDLKNAIYLPEPQTEPYLFTRKIKVDEKNKELKYLKSITYNTKSEVNEAIFRVRIFSVKEDGSPEADLILDDLIVKVKKGRHKTEVDVAAYGLEIPNEGILVGFESLLTEQNRYTEKVLVTGTNKPREYTNYAPHILYNYMDSEESFSFRDGIWTRQLFRWFKESGKGDRVIAPAIQVTLTN